MPEPALPEGGWTAVIDDVRRGTWKSPETGQPVDPAPFDAIALDTSLDGGEADLLASLGMTGTITVVADEATYDALGQRLVRNLPDADAIVLRTPHADLATAADLSERLAGRDHVVAVGSGTLNDLCKYVTAQDGRRYAVFGTAASMDGYTSTTASMTLESGLKVSMKAQPAAGVFLDLEVTASAPRRLSAAGFGDTICRSVCQTDWWLSNRLLGTPYLDTPYVMAAADEDEVMRSAARIAAGELVATGYLQRALVLSGLGVGFTQTSNHGSQSEHQISHYIDCFAGARHPGTLHGQQVGVATLTMARIQSAMLAMPEPPQLRPTRIDVDDMARRMGPDIATQCAAAYREKALDAAGAEAMNRKLAEIWPDLQRECAAFAVAPAEIERLLAIAGAPTSAADLGLPASFYREAVRHGHEMRNRFSFADIACDAGLLHDFAEEFV